MNKFDKNLIVKTIVIITTFFVISFLFSILFRLSLIAIYAMKEEQRDMGRRNILRNIQVNISEYQAQNYKQPDYIFDTSSLIVIGDKKIILEDYLVLSSNSSQNGSLYCYDRVDSGYQLGIKLENGGWYNLGTEKCEINDFIKN